MSPDVFMCIVTALVSPSKSFEVSSLIVYGSASCTFTFQEVRLEDYVLSYQTSGRPPPPVPQEPTDENQRKVLGIPPLFKPQTEITPSDGLPETSASTLGPNMASSSLLSSSSQSTTKQKIVNPTDIPLGQEFKASVIAAEKYHNIVCMPEYEGFSPEVCSLNIDITTCCVDPARW